MGQSSYDCFSAIPQVKAIFETQSPFAVAHRLCGPLGRGKTDLVNGNAMKADLIVRAYQIGDFCLRRSQSQAYMPLFAIITSKVKSRQNLAKWH